MTLEPGALGASEPAAMSTSEPVAGAGIALPPVEGGAPAAVPASRAWRAVWEFLHDLSVAVLFCFFLITFVAQAFRVQGTSMEPLLNDGERIVVNKFIYRFRTIERGDVVVFWYPRDPSVSFIKRVVALPGDTVEIRSGRLIVNGVAAPESYLPGSYRDNDNFPPTEIGKGFYFVLGDHRRSSNDSRSWGEVPERYIYGRAVFRFWPLPKVGPIH